jgi:hypothetical protein
VELSTCCANAEQEEERKKIEANLNGQREVWGLRRTFVKSWRPVSASEITEKSEQSWTSWQMPVLPVLPVLRVGCSDFFPLTQMEWAAMERAWSVEDIRIGACETGRADFFPLRDLREQYHAYHGWQRAKVAKAVAKFCYITMIHSFHAHKILRAWSLLCEEYMITEFNSTYSLCQSFQSQQREQLTSASRRIKHHMRIIC